MIKLETLARRLAKHFWKWPTQQEKLICAIHKHKTIND
jgi:hypothetical protein